MGESWEKFVEKGKALVADREFFTAILLILVATASFGLGRQSVTDSIAQAASVVKATPTQTDTITTSTVNKAVTDDTYYVASKNGSAYHLPFCSGAKRIKDENKITFNTKEEAEAAGYRPAANCPGL